MGNDNLINKIKKTLNRKMEEAVCERLSGNDRQYHYILGFISGMQRTLFLLENLKAMGEDL